jgi:alpha-galactosidase/6-phospho-beta-glucosidase family protein
MKIAFIGGGSVQWTPGLVTDMALTESLAGANLVLHDLDVNALDLLVRASERIAKEVEGKLNISTTTDRIEALRDADYVILCVGIGGLAAMCNDLEIPVQYGIYQAVGDTVGPGGLARGLRHIPFAVQVAREMEALCPNAWLLNLTNPMTTICRGITRATRIRALGLCHEVDIFRDRHVAEFFPGFLTQEAGCGDRYGVVLTTVDHREELARQNRDRIEAFANGASEKLQKSFEQLAPVMAALSGGPAGKFFVNIPNEGQIDNLPREATVECVAEVDSLGVRPLCVGPLPYPAYATIAPHVARQELIVEAALSGSRESALAALTTDPLVRDPELADPMLGDLLAANEEFMGPSFMGPEVTFKTVQ